MAEQLTLREQVDATIERVDRAADEAWKEQVLEAVRRTCEEMPEFISDQVWERGLASTREDRALGAVMQRAARLGYCTKTDRVKPSKRSNLAGKPVWRSLLFQGVEVARG